MSGFDDAYIRVLEPVLLHQVVNGVLGLPQGQAVKSANCTAGRMLRCNSQLQVRKQLFFGHLFELGVGQWLFPFKSAYCLHLNDAFWGCEGNCCFAYVRNFVKKGQDFALDIQSPLLSLSWGFSVVPLYSPFGVLCSTKTGGNKVK